MVENGQEQEALFICFTFHSNTLKAANTFEIQNNGGHKHYKPILAPKTHCNKPANTVKYV